MIEQDKDRNPPQQPVSEADEDLLTEIRADYQYALDYWRKNREEAAEDMRYVACDFFTNDEKTEREGRPCLEPDEISQYIKQANNNLRQNKRAIKVNPEGNDATDEAAELRSSIIRKIEYDSNAQAAYTTAFEQAVECGMGHFRITTAFVSGEKITEPRIKRIPNQFTVLLDPDAKEADFSDQEKCFVTDIIRKNDFARKYPKAQKKSFSAEDEAVAPQWLRGENITIAEYWRVEKDGDRKVIQYITNGVEILEKNEWAGSWIPIIPVLGEEIYVNDGGNSRRMYLSLIRRARAPQKMLAYIASQEAEEFGMSPRAPYFIWDGQEGADEEAFKYANKIPRAFIKLKPVYGENGELLPGPTRIPFVPNAQAYEIARESWRRAIQAAMGITPLPTSAQRQNEKSGVALEKIQTQEAVGSFHFTDNFQRAVELGGRMIDELIDVTMDTPRLVGVRNKDESHGLLFVTPHAKYGPPEGFDGDVLITGKGKYNVTISTGPSFQSQREEASAFVDILIQGLGKLPIPPQVQQQILAKGVKLKNVGPIGDEIADLLSPPDANNMPPQAQAAIAQAQGTIQQLQQELQQLQMEKMGKVVETQGKAQIAQMDNETKLAIAEISTKAQATNERLDMVLDMMGKLGIAQHNAAHELGMQKDQHAHEQTTLDKQAEIARSQSAQDHVQTLQQGEQSGQQALTQQEQAAKLAPKPIKK